MFERVGCFDRGDGYRAEVRHLTDARQSIHVTFPVLHLSEGAVLAGGGMEEGLLSIHFKMEHVQGSHVDYTGCIN